jgi:hypothetical protein
MMGMTTGNHDILRVRLDRVLELVQVDRADAPPRVMTEMNALEVGALDAGLHRLAEGAAAALGLARRWHRGALGSADARVAILRLTLAMLRELARAEVP